MSQGVDPQGMSLYGQPVTRPVIGGEYRDWGD